MDVLDIKALDIEQPGTQEPGIKQPKLQSPRTDGLFTDNLQAIATLLRPASKPVGTPGGAMVPNEVLWRWSPS
jgi:hypothetical protein